MTTRLLLSSAPIASLFMTLGAACLPQEGAPPTSPLASPVDVGRVSTQPAEFLGQDPFDDVRSIQQLRDLEREVIGVAERMRPSVVYLRWAGSRGGSSGTAVIISKDGLLATCGHVGRRPGRELTAVLADGTELSGRTLGQVLSDGVDCGLVQLDTKGRELHAAPLGTTVGLAKGDWLVALGYTQGLSDTVRPSLLRAGRVLHVNEKELYLDAPIDAGDSGGPSFNLRGEVVGLNARCGRLSWQNVATRIDMLSERMEALKEQREAADQPTDAVESRRSPPTGLRFPSSDDGGKSAIEEEIPLGDLVAGAVAATVRVHCNGRSVAYGVMVDASGLAVTKASQLEPNGKIEVEITGRKRVIAHEVARDATVDIALLRFAMDAAGDQPAPPATVRWAVDATLTPGSILITPRGFGRIATLGFTAIELRESETDSIDGPYLGVQTRAATPMELKRAGADRAVTIVRVLPGTAAEKAGLKQGQMLLAVDDVEVGTPVELRRTLRTHVAGNTVRVKRVEGNAASEVGVVLGRREGTAGQLRRGNTATPISARSSGFGELLPHDTVTDPDEMGGPVIDLDGRVVGMNIARFDRTATHAIGAQRMAEVCRRLMEQSRETDRPDDRHE